MKGEAIFKTNPETGQKVASQVNAGGSSCNFNKGLHSTSEFHYDFFMCGDCKKHYWHAVVVQDPYSVLFWNE